MEFGLSPQESIFLWYQQYGRHDLPWRNTSDAYRIYLSEIMLQQTQVKTVRERFYDPFLKRFPTLQSVADASLDDVLKMWEGLGYYSRAKHLHESALTCKGVLPESIEALQGLKGIGKSTAHAIGAFAYNQALPVLDANVKRILCRYFGLKVKNEKELWEKAWELLDTKRSYSYNQALMDIGALVCTAKNPRCKECPLHVTCIGRDEPYLYPMAAKKKTIMVKKKLALVLIKDEKIGLIKRSEKFLHGLWGFPQCELDACEGKKIGSVRHAYSHFKLELDVVLAHHNEQEKEWFSYEELSNRALSTVDLKILSLLKKCKKEVFVTK